MLQTVWKATVGRLFRRYRHRRLQRLRAVQPLGPRPSSAPFLSGDTFRSVCDAAWGDPEDKPFEPELLAPGAKVFCCSHALEDFFLMVAPAIRVPFVLVSGNSDRNVEPSEFSLPNTLSQWFAQNLIGTGARTKPLPIGLENRHYWNHGELEDFVELRSRPVPQENAVYYGFNTATNPTEREPLLRQAAESPLCVTKAGLDSWEYRRALRQYRFVLSPAGNGIDCHRTWEALYLNVIPVLKKSIFAQSLYDSGFPLLLLDQWDELDRYTESRLQDVYEREKTKFGTEKLWLPYWVNQLQSFRFGVNH